MSEKKRPPVKKTTQEVLKEIIQGKKNAEEFGQRCKITDEELNMRVIHHNRGLETDPSPDAGEIIRQRMKTAIERAKLSRKRSRPENTDLDTRVVQTSKLTAKERLAEAEKRAKKLVKGTEPNPEHFDRHCRI